MSAACGDNRSDDLYFTFDDRKVLCGFSIDEHLRPVDWNRLQERIDLAADEDWVLNVYAHTPGVTVSHATLDRAFTMFARAGLGFTTYRDLDPDDTPYPGVVFAFDDDAIDAWFDARELFVRHDAVLTFFVTYYASFSAEGRQRLHDLASDGHAIEAHGVNHLSAVSYATEHGAEAYVIDEVLPSLQILRDDGFDPTSFAYPGGARSEATDRAIEPHVRY
ncbi:MAG: polysaccharide deacetylase family protein, partial [Deltaproteobacteria bacterium]|nr:polysaccharide deacetylase family protein [Deltaproteobacteria bacterium]